jgi:hypothetical protein
MKRRPSEAELEHAKEVTWIILAVERFGSVGNRTAIGEALARDGFIVLDGSKASLTPKGELWAEKIRNARHR